MKKIFAIIAIVSIVSVGFTFVSKSDNVDQGQVKEDVANPKGDAFQAKKDVTTWD
jgi:uncharacterized protein YxeA